MPKGTRTRTKADFWVVPKSASGCVVVFHEVWGLVSHTEDVCKRLGKLGFAATAPNLYKGHDDILTPDNIQRTMEGVWELSLAKRLDKAKVADALDKKHVGREVKEAASIIYNQEFRDRMLADAVSAVEAANSKFDGVSTLGFCLGGGLALKASTRSRHLVSAAGFYGVPPTGEEVRRITIPILAIYASKDEIINQSVPAFVGAMLTEGKDLTLKTYPRTRHGFFNDSRKDVYQRKSAAESWELTRWFLERTLGKL
ncbi:MAG: dienelactone hydrolase family protein [Candidatus Gagatemarchaeaceae archaeon]